MLASVWWFLAILGAAACSSGTLHNSLQNEPAAWLPALLPVLRSADTATLLQVKSHHSSLHFHLSESRHPASLCHSCPPHPPQCWLSPGLSPGSFFASCSSLLAQGHTSWGYVPCPFNLKCFALFLQGFAQLLPSSTLQRVPAATKSLSPGTKGLTLLSLHYVSKGCSEDGIKIFRLPPGSSSNSSFWYRAPWQAATSSGKPGVPGSWHH